MKFLRSLLSVVGITAALTFAPRAEAQLTWSGASTTTYSAGTNKAMALTTNAYFQIDVPKTEELALFVNSKHLNASGAGDVDSIRIDFYRGIDPGKWETNIWRSWTVATGASTASNADMTNWTVTGIPYLRARIANVSTNSHATNVLVLYGGKR